jgi:phosphoribosyl 1,2-cyclic phosphodiesterase
MNLGMFSSHDPSLTRFTDNLEVIRRYQPKRTVLTHVEEHFHLDIKRQSVLEQKYRHLNISIAHDFQQMKI